MTTITQANSEALELVDRLTAEGLIGVSQAARLLGTFRNGKPTHPSTLVRWMAHGITLAGGHTLTLEHIKLNGRLATTKPAILRFLAAQQDGTGGVGSAPSTDNSPPRSPAQRNRESEAAGRELKRLGS